MASSDSEVRGLLDIRVDASQAKDIDRLMSLYSPDIIYFDVVPPLQFTGAADVRRNFMRWFDEYDGPISLETHDLTVATSADVASTSQCRVPGLCPGKRNEGIYPPLSQGGNSGLELVWYVLS
jgi:ketosteroid isomerase-like protein